MNFAQVMAGRSMLGGVEGLLQREAQTGLLEEMAAIVAYHQAQNMLQVGAIALTDAQAQLEEQQGLERVARERVTEAEDVTRRAHARVVLTPAPAGDREAQSRRRLAEDIASKAEHDLSEVRALLVTRQNALHRAEKHVADIQTTMERLRAIPRPTARLLPMLAIDTGGAA